MKKLYYVKKESETHPGGKWVRMSSYDFSRFVSSPEGKQKKGAFGQINACGDDDDIIVIECGKKKAKELRSYRDRCDYSKEAEKESGYIVMSYSDFDSEGGTLYGEECIPDDSPPTEELVMKELQKEILHKAVSMLVKEEEDLINALFFGTTPLSERLYADMTGRTRNEVHTLKMKALRHLKRILVEYFKFDSPYC